MCGIAGYRTNKPISPMALSTMLDVIKHRGPDSTGTYFESDYSGDMSRLAQFPFLLILIQIPFVFHLKQYEK